MEADEGSVGIVLCSTVDAHSLKGIGDNAPELLLGREECAERVRIGVRGAQAQRLQPALGPALLRFEQEAFGSHDALAKAVEGQAVLVPRRHAPPGDLLGAGASPTEIAGVVVLDQPPARHSASAR